MSATTVIGTKNLKKIYRRGRGNPVVAVGGVDFSLEKGDFVALVGSSGSGKSTFMHLIGLLQSPTQGEVILGGQKMSEIPRRKYPAIRARKIGFVFQGFNLIPTLTALENIALAGSYAGLGLRETRRRALSLLEHLGLGERTGHRPSELSGGQCQRVAIARALINRPSIILADEPTGELDTKSSLEIVKILKELNEAGETILIVTHNPEVAKMCRRRVEMMDGLIVSQGPKNKS